MPLHMPLSRKPSSKSNTSVRKSTITHLGPQNDQYFLTDHSSELSTVPNPNPSTISTLSLDRSSTYSDASESIYNADSGRNKPLPSKPQAETQERKYRRFNEEEALRTPQITPKQAEPSYAVDEDIGHASREGLVTCSPDRKSLNSLAFKLEERRLGNQQALKPTSQYSENEAFQNIDINEPSVQGIAEPPPDMPEKTIKKKWLVCSLIMNMVLLVAVVVVSLHALGVFGSHGPNLFKASNPSSTTIMTPIMSSVIASISGASTVRVPSSETNVASTVSVTSVFDSSTTTSQSSTPSPEVSSGSIKSAPSSDVGSDLTSQLVSAMTIADDLVGRSEYIGCRDETFNGNLIFDRAQEVIEAGEPSITCANEEEKREEECTTTTLTTTLTTTITSTLHSSRSTAPSAESPFSSVQSASDESEQESSNVSPTNESPTSHRYQSTSDLAVLPSAVHVGFNPLESTYATLSQTPDPTPTLPPSTAQTGQFRNTDASVLSASSSAAGARLGVPSWDTFQRLRRFSPFNPIVEEDRHILPSITPTPTATKNDEIGSGPDDTSTTLLSASNVIAATRRGFELPPFADILTQALDLTTKIHLPTLIDFKSKGSATRQPLHTPSSNAAAPRHAAPWRRVTFMPTNPHRRRQVTKTLSTPTRIAKRTPAPTYPPVRCQNSSATPSSDYSGGKLTFWEAFSQLRLQVVQMCFDVKTYQDTTLTPVQAPEDLLMGKALDEKICSTLDQSFPPAAQGGKCDTKSEWESLESKVREVCGLQRIGQKLVQDVEELCGVKDVYTGNLDTCGSEALGIGSTVTGGASNLTANSSGLPAADSVTASSTLGNATNAESPSITIQQHSITTPTLSPTVSSVGLTSTPTNAPLLTSTNAPSPTLSTLPETIVAACPAIPETPVPPSCIGKLPSHYKLTPPPDWTMSMLTYSTQAANYTNLLTIPANAVATPPVYTGPQLSRSWPVSYAFPIPTGYVAPNIVPASPQIGQLTYFDSGLGACAYPEMVTNELAVAISWELFDMGREIGDSSLVKDWHTTGSVGANGIDTGGSALCNQGIRAWIGDAGGGKAVEMEFVVRDRCEGCNVSDIDIQPAVFDKYWGTRERGRIMVTWEWMTEAPTDVPK